MKRKPFIVVSEAMLLQDGYDQVEIDAALRYFEGKIDELPDYDIYVAREL